MGAEEIFTANFTLKFNLTAQINKILIINSLFSFYVYSISIAIFKFSRTYSTQSTLFFKDMTITLQHCKISDFHTFKFLR